MPAAISPERPKNGIVKFTNCRLVKGDDLVEEDIWFTSVSGKILQSQETFYDYQATPDEIVDLGGRIVSPGFIDVQINGAFGFDFSVVSDGTSTYTKGLREALPLLGPSGNKRSVEDGAESLGAHCEGPFISPTKNGIHTLEVLQHVKRGFTDFEDCYGAKNLQRSPNHARPNVRMVTAAPEVGNVLAAIPEIVHRDILFSIGHTEATFEEASRAVDAGATMVTHLFNAMKPLHHRNPGVFGILGKTPSHKRPYFGVICDGFHLHPTTVRIAWNAHPEGLILVTDAMKYVGLPDGVYDWTNGERITKAGGLLTLEGSDRIAGSSVTLIECVSNFLTWTGASIPEAIKAVTSTPAKLLGLEHEKGSLRPGADADFVVIREVVDGDANTKLLVDEVWKFGVRAC
ncbi:N-acetyl-glucosamine-6-phosphate deacetylase [Elasticomyces elasticus]|nr:N-acetyl-glucosamine-6-phosphate deacetylase [Elasticomyces elasticus]